MNPYFESHVSLILIIAEIRSYIKGFMTPNCPYSPMFSSYATNGTTVIDGCAAEWRFAISVWKNARLRGIIRINMTVRATNGKGVDTT